MSEQRRLDFGHFVDRVFWALITAAVVFAAHSVSELNEKMAVVVDHLGYADKRADSHESRIQRLEEKLIRR